MSDDIFFDGLRYLSAAEASVTADLSRDYIARLCRDGKVRGRRIGKNWYVHEDSLKQFLLQQEHAKVARREQLSDQRSKEYVAAHGPDHEVAHSTPRSAHASPVPETHSDARPVMFGEIKHDSVYEIRPSAITKTLASHAMHVQRALKSGVLAGGESAMRYAPSMLATPSGVHEAVARTLGHGGIHVPVYTITPFAEFIQKFVALLIAFTMTFGTYALVDPTYARFALTSMRDTVAAASQSYRDLTNGGTDAFATRAKERVAFAAENPSLALSQASAAALGFIPDSLRNFARAINTGVDDLVYAIAFPGSVTDSVVRVPRGNASVAIEIAPYARGAQNAAPNSTSTLPENPTQSAPRVVAAADPVTIIERRIETERLVSTVGGITEEYLNARLLGLESSLRGPLVASSGGGGNTTINNNYNLISQSNNIDKLGSITIDNSTFSGGTITGSTITGGSFSGGSVSATSLSASDTSTLATTTITGSLTVSGDTSISGTLTIPGALSISSSTISLLTNTYATTSFISAVTASTTNLTWQYATGTNLTVFNAISAPAFSATSTTATSTFAGGALFSRAPSIAHTFSSWAIGASNSGLYDAALVVNPVSAVADGNLISASVNGSVKFLVDTEGDVFVNNLTSVGSVTLSTTTASTFTVEGNATFGDALTDIATVNGTLNVTGTTTVATSQGNFGIGTSTPWARLSVAGAAGGTAPLFAISSSTSGYSTSSVFHIDSNGWVGIGSTTPAAKFAVDAPIFVGGSGVTATSTFAGNLHVVGNIKVGTNSSYISDSNISTVGSLTVTGTTTLTGLLSLSTASTSQLSVFEKAYFGGTATSTFDSTGSLGIGTTPSYKLDVSSTASTDAAHFRSANGTISEVFLADAANGTALYVDNWDNSSGAAVQFVNNSYNIAWFGNNGNVGIGNIAPWTKLSVSGGFAATASSTIGDGTQGGGLTISGGATTTGNLVVSGTGTSTFAGGLTVGTTNLVVQNATGNVGVGTANPFGLTSTARTLEVSGQNYGAVYTLAGTTRGMLYSDTSNNWVAIGSRSNSALRLDTNDIERVRITTDGFVGIGTTSPLSELHVSNSDSGVLLVEDSDDGFLSLLSLNGTGNSALYFDNGGDFTIESQAFANRGTVSASTARLAIDGSSGNVGIGTTTPGGKLTVAGGGSGVTSLIVTANTSDNDYIQKWTNSTSGGSGLSFLSAVRADGAFAVQNTANRTNTVYDGNTGKADYIGNEGYWAIRTNTAKAFNLDMYNNASSLAALTVVQSGNVGVGTTTPWAKLALSLNNGETYGGNNAFIISSSTASATSTLFSVSNTGKLSLTSTAADFFTLTGASSRSLGVSASGILNWNAATVLGSSSWAGTADTELASTGAGRVTALVNYSGSESVDSLRVLGASSANVFSVQGSNVNIGTSTPWAKVTINADSGTTQPYNNLFLISSSTASASTTLFSVSNTGNVALGAGASVTPVSSTATYNINTSNTGIIEGNNSALALRVNGTAKAGLLNEFEILDSVNLIWRAGIGTGASDLGLARQSAGVLKISDGSSGNGSLLALASSTIGGGTATTGLTISGGATTTGNLIVQGSATSTFSNGVSATYLNITGTGATSTFANGFVVNGGCILVGGTCLTNSTGASTGVANTFTALQTFAAGASTTQLSVFQKAYFGGTATSTFNSDGSLTMVAPITSTATSYNTFPYASTTALSVSGTAYFAGSGIWNSSGFLGVGTTSPWAKLSITATDNASDPQFVVASSSAVSLMVASTGNVGIGTTTASSLFTLQQSSNSTTGGVRSYNSAGTQWTTLYTGSDNASYFQNANGYVALSSSGNLGVGTTTPWARLSVTATDNASAPQFVVASSSAVSLLVTSTGNVGIGTTTPWSNVNGVAANLDLTSSGVVRISMHDTASTQEASITNNGGGLFLRVGGAATASSNIIGFYTSNTDSDFTLSERMRIDSSGYVGIGTTSPFRKFSVTDAVATAQVAVSYDTTRNTDILTDSAGDLWITPSGDDATLGDANLWVCASGSCPSGTPSGTGNLIVESKLGIGTSTPFAGLGIGYTTGIQNVIDNQSLFANNVYFDGSAWKYMSTATYEAIRMYDRSSDGSINFHIGASASAGATATNMDGTDTRMVILGSGKVGIGTTSPTDMLSVHGLLRVGASSVAPVTMGTATSTFNGDIKILGKLDVATIDPVYTIAGTKYATYGHSTVGIKEETMQTIHLKNGSGGEYSYTINFNELERGSDLWLFHQITDFGEEWKNLVVSLTPAFDGTVHYSKNVAENTLTISGDRAGEVSMRLVGSRYDFSKWPNLRPDQDGDTAGTHVIPEKPTQ